MGVCGSSAKTRIRRDDRVVIIGAGPAGIHMATLLKQQGYRNITILEKGNRIGGKTYSVTSAGVTHEMGACWLSTDYSEVRHLLNTYNGGLELKPGGKTGKRSIRDEHNEFKGELDTWMFGEVHKNTAAKCPRCLAWICSCLPAEFSIPAIFTALQHYTIIHTRILGEYQFHFPRKPSPEKMALLNMTLGDFLRQHNLDALIPAITLAQAAQGYGFLERVPAYYGLVWMTPEFWRGYLNMTLKLGPPVPSCLEKGFQTLFENMYEKEKLNVVFNFNIDSINRNLDKAAPRRGKAPAVEIKGHTADTNEARVFEADFLIVAAPLVEVSHLFTDFQADEHEIVSALKPLTMCTTLLSAKIVHGEECMVSWPHALTLEGKGHIYTMRNSRLTLMDGPDREILYESGGPKPKVAKDRMTVDGHEPGAGDNRIVRDKVNASIPTNPQLEIKDPGAADTDQYVTYQITDEALNDEQGKQRLRDVLVQDLQERKREDVNVLMQCVYPYFYHFSLDDICKKGLPWKMLAMQGTHRTWYIGASASFESVLHVIQYNRMLVHKYLRH